MRPKAIKQNVSSLTKPKMKSLKFVFLCNFDVAAVVSRVVAEKLFVRHQKGERLVF